MLGVSDKRRVNTTMRARKPEYWPFAITGEEIVNEVPLGTFIETWDFYEPPFGGGFTETWA